MGEPRERMMKGAGPWFAGMAGFWATSPLTWRDGTWPLVVIYLVLGLAYGLVGQNMVAVVSGLGAGVAIGLLAAGDNILLHQLWHGVPLQGVSA